MPDHFRIFSRRAFLIGGTVGVTAFALRGDTQPSGCMLSSEEEIGPFYVDRELLRKDITEGKPGLPLKLRVTIVDGTRCTPIRNAALDIWHCDSGGIYSGFTSDGPDRMQGPPPRGGFGGRPDGPPPGPPPGFGNRKVDKTTFLRGIQVTDADGRVEFTTMYPGWYSGRDTHIHIRVRIGGSATEAKYTGGHVCHTAQLFFPDDVSDTVAKIGPYREHQLARTRHEDDDVFTSQNGQGSIVDIKQINDGSLSGGLIATSVVVVNPQASPAPAGRGGPGGPGGAPPFPG